MKRQTPIQQRLLVFAILAMAPVWLLAKELPGITVRFYSTGIELPALYGSELDLPEEINKAVIIDAYEHFQNCRYQPFLQSLTDQQAKYNFSDWHLYEIVSRASEVMFHDARYQILFQWFILRMAGIDAQLFYAGSEVYLHAPTKDVEFGFYTLEFHGQKYVNLTAKRNNLKMDEVKPYLPELIWDGRKRRAMTMHMEELPKLPDAVVVDRLLEFSHAGQKHRMMVKLNKDHLDMMDDYPYYSQSQFFHMELSPEAEGTLLPKLEEMLRGRTQLQKIEFLLSFVRTAFLYKDDRNRFGHEKPMSPEQTLYYSYSDCEDRSALFFYLSRKLLKIPAIVLDFEEHVGVALELPNVKGEFFRFQDRRFVYCEATGPDDKLAIGEMWEYVRGQKARILTAYLPQPGEATSTVPKGSEPASDNIDP